MACQKKKKIRWEAFRGPRNGLSLGLKELPAFLGAVVCAPLQQGSRAGRDAPTLVFLRFWNRWVICRRSLTLAGARGTLSEGPVARATGFRPPSGPGGNMERGVLGPGRARFLACACFLTDNLFVERYGLHLRYRGDPEQLRRDYGPVLRQRGCRSEEDFAPSFERSGRARLRRKPLRALVALVLPFFN
ncbi:hypothetical protein E2320_012482 [Naja naja]|nr:hypothetical protein E2320_012482 [Naja naja]